MIDRIENGLPVYPVKDSLAVEKVLEKNITEKDLKIEVKNEESKEKKEYKHEDAVIDAEIVKRFLYMLAGIPYKEKDDNEKSLNRWA